MKKQILLIVMTLCAVSAMAVSLPRDSYKPYSGSLPSSQGYTLGTGTAILNHSTVGAYEGVCTTQSEWTSGDINPCPACCTTNVFLPCLNEKKDAGASECVKLQEQCVDICSLALNDFRTPLDAPTAFLLALVAAYGAVAVCRRKMQQA